jgi:fructosamine-3-kinase
MISSIPENLQAEIKSSLNAIFDCDVNLKDFNFSSGGCINSTGTISTDKGLFFLKWNTKSRFPDMFEKEASGLKLLKKVAKNLKIPEVLGYGDDGDHIFILMENIAQGDRKMSYWKDLGNGLAELHSHTSGFHGLEYSNYIGSLIQENSPNKEWLEFFIVNRLEKPFSMAYDLGLLGNDLKSALNSLIAKLPEICPGETKASLMHGDLWSGHLMIGPDGEPCLIDPAVYFGFREMEIAFTQLFGRYNQVFYDSYNETWPLDDGFEERMDIWNLYPLLVHVNLFGAGYIGSVRQILRRFQ